MEKFYYFGIDGGGTYSRLALIDAGGNLLAKSEAGSTNIYSVTQEEAFANLSLLLDSALKNAGIEKAALKAGCFGSSGLGRHGDQKIFRAYFDKALGAEFPVKLCNDGEILLCGGLAGLEGYCLIAGTGSIALGRSREGSLVRSGGHGYMLGDEGSAAWIGRSAVARILRSLENRDLPTEMLEPILKKAELSEAGDFVRYVHHDADKAEIARLAPLVTEAARKGDPLALSILYRGAEELVLLVKSVMGLSPWIKNRELVLAGGVIEHDELLTGKLKQRLKEELPELKVSLPKGTALEGACVLALSAGS